MNTTIKAGLLLNAIKAPYEIFMKLCENYEPEDLFKGESFWEELEMSKSVQNRLAGIIAKDGWAERELEHAEKLDARFITAQDLDYPEKLRDLKKPPIGIYIRGNANILSLPSVAIVGTRKCSSYGHDVAYRLASLASQRNIIIISGGAKGIDASAHRGCLDFDGRTVAVFGTGLEKTYPAEHKELFSRILEHGALITEYPMTSGGEVWRFSERNRIIAALASRVVIVESPEGGGAMKTANLGLELGREVLSVPGRINEDSFKGSNELLNKGTGALTSLEEFINSIAGNTQFEINLDDNSNKSHEDSQNALSLNSDEEKIIYSLIQKHERITTDDLLSESGLDFVTIQGVLIELEANGLINGEAGRYSLAIR
ncbi:MAG: DNA-processing protein DprA [Synergistaceae bacterium]|nr:DNA-processing protein DprA [Synergistaceae bacterium]